MADLSEVKSALQDLIDAANAGDIVPVHLPRQLVAIQDSLIEAEQALHEDAPEPTSEVATLMELGETNRIAFHELRTPMTSIRGYADMLANKDMGGELTDMQNQLLDYVRTNTTRVESLLKDLSNLNKLQTGIMQTRTNIDLFKNVAQMAERDMQPVAEDFGRSLVFDIPQGLPLLNTDSELLALAMSKFIENGLRYNVSDDAQVTVSANGEDNNLIITIADNGIGMAPAEVKQLGTVFFRSEHEVVRAYKGSGLGVYIAYGILDLLDASYAISTEVDGGTTVRITLQGMS